MRLPVQAVPVARSRTLLGHGRGVRPSSIPCYLGNSCDMEDFVGLVNNCNECLALCGHSIGNVGNCTACTGPLPPNC